MASVPSTPARYTVLPNKSRSAAPVTPTRHNHNNHRHQRSLFLTPTSSSHLNSLSYNSDASFDTPDTFSRGYQNPNGYTDLAQSWQSKVQSSEGYQNYENHFVDMEGEQNHFISGDPAVLATPFHGGGRGRSRAQSLSHDEFAADMSVASRTFNGYSNQPLISSPLNTRMLPVTPGRKQNQVPISPLANRRTLAPLNTPPPNRILAQQYKMKGSYTDPIRQRKRPSVGQAQPVQELFNIDENDCYPNDSFDQEDSIYDDIENSLEQRFHLGGVGNTVFDPPAPIQFQHPQQHHYQHSLPVFPQPYYGMYMNPPPYNVYGMVDEKPVIMAENMSGLPAPVPSSCSVCGRRGKGDGMLAVLHPCAHPLCSTCLTAALNIVGEKDMECAVCKQPVVDFKLVGADKKKDSKPEHVRSQSLFDSSFSSPGSSADGKHVMSVEEEEGFPIFDDEAVRASTPKFGESMYAESSPVVLRIDNVPWDITPPTIVEWLRQPIERVHVLLDRKGKTMSHAFVEVKNEDVARAVLRGETLHGRSRSSVLGKGKRARGVTVTRSGQEELMAALFPSWKGTFVGAKPSLAGVGNSNIASSLECGLLTENDVTSLLKLIQSPDSHFLKVPVLPFHSLISLLAKFPGDIDSRIFCPVTLRDKLNNLATVAVNVLVSRIEKLKGDAMADELVLLAISLLKAAISCQAFSEQQVQAFVLVLDRDILKRSSPSPSNNNSIASSTPSSPPHSAVSLQDALSTSSSYSSLAKEFGVTVDVVEALAHRLATSTKV